MSLKPRVESYHDANFVVIGSTGGCHNDNLRCHQWQQCWHHDNSRFAVYASGHAPIQHWLPISYNMVNTLRPEEDGRHLADDILCIYEKCSWLEVLLKLIPEGPINNKSAMVQVKGWHRLADRPLSKLIRVIGACVRHQASMSFVIQTVWPKFRICFTVLYVSITSILWWLVS